MSLVTCSDQSQRGSLFTLFLYSPLLAFSSICGLNSLRRGLWDRAQEFLRKVYRDIGQMITRSRTIGITCSIDNPRMTIRDPSQNVDKKKEAHTHFNKIKTQIKLLIKVKRNVNYSKSNTFWQLFSS